MTCEYISGSKNPAGVDWAFREALDRPLPSEKCGECGTPYADADGGCAACNDSPEGRDADA
jgi:uncharacterized OB-fold protein